MERNILSTLCRVSCYVCSTLVVSTRSFFPTIAEATLFSEFPRVIFIRTGYRKVIGSTPR